MAEVEGHEIVVRTVHVRSIPYVNLFVKLALFRLSGTDPAEVVSSSLEE